MKRLLLLFASWSLAGLAGAADEQERFSDPKPPVSGFARLYIFRPDFSSMGRYDSPALTLNGQEVGKLDNRSYVEVLLRGGTVDFALKPSVFASSSWDISGTMQVQAGQKYYLAIWAVGEGGSPDGMKLVPVLGGGLPLLPVPARTSIQMRVLSEVVDESAALDALRGLVRVGLEKTLD